jgi:hypothetical protein
MNSKRRSMRLATRIGIKGAMVLALLALVAPLSASAHVATRAENN